MPLIRPAAQTQMKRWFEPLIAAALLGLGLWWGLTSLGVIKWLGVALAVLGAALLVQGIRRARFWRGSGGLGHIELDEGALTYFAPVGGGAVAVDTLDSVILSHRPGLGRAWGLSAPFQPVLWVPVDASGTPVLFDVFTNLPGLDMQALLRTLNAPQDNDVVIWRRKRVPLH